MFCESRLAGELGEAALAQKVRDLVSNADGAEVCGQLDLARPNGADLTLALSGNRLQGGAERWLWQLHDVSELARAAGEAARQRDLLAALLDTLPVGCLTLHADGTLKSANRAARTLLHTDEEDICHWPALPELLPGAQARSLLASPFHAGQMQTVDLEVPQTGAIRLTVSGLDRGAGGGAVATLVERGREMQLEDDLQRLANRFERLFRFAPVAVAILDSAGSLRAQNPAFANIFGGAGDLVGTPIEDLVHSDDRAEFARHMKAALEGERWPDGLEIELAPGSGGGSAHVFANRMPDETGQHQGLVLHLVETTEQRNLELRFAQSQKMQAVGQLAGGIAHDFNNLLTAMIGHCDLLLLRVRPGDELFPDIMQVKQNANRAANLIRQLLAFSRRQTLQPKQLSITDVLAELAHLIQRLIGETIELEISHDQDLGLVMADQGQFEQVIINLAVNARDAMPEGGRLIISTRNISGADEVASSHELMPAGNYVLIEVEDTGKGISSGDLGRIFEPFFTTKQPSSSTQGAAASGTGLGLSTVFGIIKQSNGFIFPESELGRGTIFRIFLPRYERDAETAEADGKQAGEEAAAPADLTGKGSILLVEDEEAVRVFAARALRNKGYHVIEADSGESALEELENLDGDVDLLISDVVMPQMDGPTLVREVRRERPDLKVIFISGYAEDAFRKTLDPDAEFILLPKPFSLKQLAGKVKEVIGA